MHDGAGKPKLVQVEAPPLHANIPDGLDRKAPYRDHEQEDDVLHDENGNACDDRVLKPAGGKHARVEGYDGYLEEELAEGVDLLADPVGLEVESMISICCPFELQDV